MKKFLLFYLVFISSLTFSQTLLETVNLPAGTFYTQGYGLVYNGGKYWISSGSSTTGKGIIYAVNNAGVQVDMLDFDLNWIRESQGLAFDGTDFWYVERKTARCDLYKVSNTGIVVDSIPTAELFGSTSIYLGGAAWDGDGLWISVYSPDARAALYKVNVAARAIVDTISVIGLQPQGITVKGDTLFYVMDGFQGDDEKIYAIDLNTEVELFSFHVPETPGVRQNPRGLAWDGTYFWLMAEPVGATSGRQLFKYDLEGSGTPEITLPVSTINFPNTTVGNSYNYYLTIYSTGTATLTIDSITITGIGYSFSPLTFPINIPAGSSYDLVVNFAPLQYSYYQGLLKIYCNDPVSLVNNINLRGQGVLSGARIGLSATSHNFGNVWVGEEGIAFWRFKIISVGDQTLQISDLHFNLPEFTYSAPTLPFSIPSTDTLELTAYFYPTQVGTYLDTLKISNNDLTNPVAKIPMQGTGNFSDYNYGYMFWQFQVPPHPSSPSASPRIEGLKYINDITGDGVADVIISTENYWTMCLDGAASGATYPIWIFTTYMSSSNAGSIGANFEYGVQDAIQIANDLNGDGYDDVVLAIGGGNEHVYVLSGKTGQIIWQYGDDINWDLGDFEAVDVQRDFNGDGIVDILAIADGNEQGTGYKRAFLFEGRTGNILWEHPFPGPNPSFGKTIISIDDLNGDNKPDVVIAYGNNGTTDLAVRALNGTNGQTLWTRPMLLYEPKELLELPLPNGNSDIIAAEYFNRIHRLDGATGSILWTYPLGASAGVIQITLINDINSDQIPDVVIASFANNGLNCLSGANGAQLWSWQMDYQFGVATIPDINDDGFEDVLAAARYGNFYCISGIGDSLIYLHSFPGDWMYSVNKIPSIDGNFSYELLAGTRDGKVVCFSGGTVAVPVELTSFTGHASDNDVNLIWTTATETNNSGFEVERKISDTWEKIGFVAGSGTTTDFRTYSFVDENAQYGIYSYRLKQIDFNGSFEYSETIEIEVNTPSQYSLEQNYPNPFNPTTTISYSLKETGVVSLKVFDILGNEVTTLINEEMSAGTYQYKFDASALSSGIYFYTLKAGNFLSTKKMILLK
ncbi:MAG: choice-of-anchor D domain-containing protein [bacterium]|nr:choice-of-anchor D domain-containing protein [bacterium]